MTKPNATIPYVTRNLRHLLAAPNLTETQRTIITRTLATLSEAYPEEPSESERIMTGVAITDILSEMTAKIDPMIDEIKRERGIGGR